MSNIFNRFNRFNRFNYSAIIQRLRFSQDSQKFVSRLSPHLHFGEISPNEVWYRAKTKETIPGIDKSLAHFHSELGWREFSYYLLYHFPDFPSVNFQKKFDSFPWKENKDLLKLWQSGKTGYPIVDAGMRELWKTGYMHNRLLSLIHI